MCEFLPKHFLDICQPACFQYFNPDTLLSLYQTISGDPTLHMTRLTDIGDDSSLKKPAFTHSICFKGRRNEGHYVYIDTRNNVYGTYERDILCDNDDGICHLYALFCAIKHNELPLPAPSEYFFVGFNNYPFWNQQLIFDFRTGINNNNPLINHTNAINLISNYYLLLSFLYRILQAQSSTGIFIWNVIMNHYFPHEPEPHEISRQTTIAELDNWFAMYRDTIIQSGVIRRVV